VRVFFTVTVATIFLIFAPLLSPSEIVTVEGPNYSFDFPEGWKSVDSYNRSSDQWDLSFTNRSNTAFINIVVFPEAQFKSAEDTYRYVKDSLKAEGEGAPFSYSGLDSYIADLTLISREKQKRGYFVFINGRHFDYAILSFTDISLYKKNIDEMLSAIDSFSTEAAGRLEPGPISQFYYPYRKKVQDKGRDHASDGSNFLAANINIGGDTYRFYFDRRELEATQVLVEREARILSTYRAGTTLAVSAWKRFYRMIYRDNYHRFDGFSEEITEKRMAKGESKEQVTEELVEWIQSFKYSRTDTISDLLSPLSTAATASGDCDSRSLLMVILSRHIGSDAVLLVSSRYSHSATGLDLPIDGARIQYGKKSYLYAEMTEKVKIGMVPQSMSDPSGWIVVDF